MSRAQIVAAMVRDGDRLLLVHRSPSRRWYPDVWDVPGGHIEDGESPAVALARELREELGIGIAPPPEPPMLQVRGATFDMQVWLIEQWTGTPANTAPEEHDALDWFGAEDLPGLHLAHDSYLKTFTELLNHHRSPVSET